MGHLEHIRHLAYEGHYSEALSLASAPVDLDYIVRHGIGRPWSGRGDRCAGVCRHDGHGVGDGGRGDGTGGKHGTDPVALGYGWGDGDADGMGEGLCCGYGSGLSEECRRATLRGCGEANRQGWWEA